MARCGRCTEERSGADRGELVLVLGDEGRVHVAVLEVLHHTTGHQGRSGSSTGRGASTVRRPCRRGPQEEEHAKAAAGGEQGGAAHLDVQNELVVVNGGGDTCTHKQRSSQLGGARGRDREGRHRAPLRCWPRQMGTQMEGPAKNATRSYSPSSLTEAAARIGCPGRKSTCK
jgi:hypothetical protein